MKKIILILLGLMFIVACTQQPDYAQSAYATGGFVGGGCVV